MSSDKDFANILTKNIFYIKVDSPFIPYKKYY